jgi:hypothetical protein
MIILSLSTIPNRLNNATIENKIGPVIKRLTTLSYPDYEIHLNIPYVNIKSGEEYNIPEWLNNYSDKLKIFRTEDYGSITKLIPTLKRITDPEQIIITLDDDLEYMDGFIEYYLKQPYENCALGFAGIGGFEDGHWICTVEKDTRVKIIEGYKTAFYKRKFFDNDFYEFAKYSWNDDMVISSYLGKNNIKKYVLKYDLETDFKGRVESFPCIRILPNERGGCFLFRNQVHDNYQFYSVNGYLDR